MPYQLELEEALRDWGLSDYLRLVNGHRTRGSSVFNPGGATNHHTAGSRRYSMPSLDILINGRAGLAGPLCNVGQSRSTEFDPRAEFDIIYLIACGRANHAGKGGWRGLVGNSSVLGLEIEHVGSLYMEPWPERRQHTAYRIHCAFAEVGSFDVGMVHQHKEWTPRKIDFIGAHGDSFRDAVALTQLSRLSPEAATIPGDDDEVWELLIVWSYNDARGNGDTANPSYDVRERDPGGFKTWIVRLAKQESSADRMAQVNYLRSLLKLPPY